MDQLRLMLVDDHEVVRLGLKSLIERFENLSVITEAGNEEEAVEKALEARPDIVLMDIRLNGGNGIEACRKIIQQLPDTRVIMLTSYAEDEMLVEAINAGASGYVLKQVGSTDLIRTIEAVSRGESALDSALTQKLFEMMRSNLRQKEETAFQELSDQELQVLNLISEGKTNKEIASALYLSPGTVRNYVSNIFSKIQVANRAEAAAYAHKHRLKAFLDS